MHAEGAAPSLSVTSLDPDRDLTKAFSSLDLVLQGLFNSSSIGDILLALHGPRRVSLDISKPARQILMLMLESSSLLGGRVGSGRGGRHTGLRHGARGVGSSNIAEDVGAGMTCLTRCAGGAG